MRGEDRTVNLAQDLDLEMKRFSEKVAPLQGDSTLVERPRVRQRLDPVPYMPGLVPAELAQWMEDRQADLQEALNLDDTNRILELTSKLSEGAERLAEMACRRDKAVVVRFSLCQDWRGVAPRTTAQETASRGCKQPDQRKRARGNVVGRPRTRSGWQSRGPRHSSGGRSPSSKAENSQ